LKIIACFRKQGLFLFGSAISRYALIFATDLTDFIKLKLQKRDARVYFKWQMVLCRAALPDENQLRVK
jgi:hypothetical protein